MGKKIDFSEIEQRWSPEELAYMDSCSATDCTGLIPNLPVSDAEIESYEELYPFLKMPKEENRE